MTCDWLLILSSFLLSLGFDSDCTCFILESPPACVFLSKGSWLSPCNLQLSQFLILRIAKLLYILSPIYFVWNAKMRSHSILLLLTAVLVTSLGCFGSCTTLITDKNVHSPQKTLDQRQYVPFQALQHAKIEGLDESTTSLQDSELAIPVGPNSRRKNRRDITTDLDYRCGEKYGRCPSGTCCSSAGKSISQIDGHSHVV